MPRCARIIPTEGILHITARGNNKRVLFRKEKDFHYMLKLLYEYKTLYSCLIHHYALMKNHIHLVVGIVRGSLLSKMMHGICQRYAHYYKKRHKHVGHFWQDRFKSYIIGDDEYLLTSNVYVEMNPVKAGYVSRPEDYPWTSYNFYAFGQENKIIDIDPLYESLGPDPEARQVAYRGMVKGRMAECILS